MNKSRSGHCQSKVAGLSYSTEDRELGRPELTPLGKCCGMLRWPKRKSWFKAQADGSFMDKTADSTNRASGPQLKREQAAMLSHYELMHGLALISNLRLRKYLGLIEAQRAKKTVEEDPLDTLRKAMRQEASIKPKARMLWDENREIDLYTWGPLQLFFCVAWAFLDKYRYLSAQHPNLVSADLDRYIEENRAGLDATRDLRDWVLHPGGSRQPDSAMEMLFSAGGVPGNAYPLEMVNRLVNLAAKFLEQLGE